MKMKRWFTVFVIAVCVLAGWAIVSWASTTNCTMQPSIDHCYACQYDYVRDLSPYMTIQEEQALYAKLLHECNNEYCAPTPCLCNPGCGASECSHCCPQGCT